MLRPYDDFELLIQPSGDQYLVQLVNSPNGQASGQFASPFTQIELSNFYGRIGQMRRSTRRVDSPDLEAAKKFGDQLFRTVFTGEILGQLRSNIERSHERGRGLRIRLRLKGVPALAELPWEFLYDLDQDHFLATSTMTPMVRYLDLPQGVNALKVRPPLRILAVLAGPRNLPKLDAEGEWQRLKTGVSNLEAAGNIVLERLPAATLDALRRRARGEPFHILHFIGHGGFDKNAGDGVLHFEDNEGMSDPVPGRLLGNILRDHDSLRLSVLNACEGARQSTQDPFSGVAQSLCQQRLPAVVAMQFEISDDAAKTFAEEFYGAIADGYPVDAAVSESRKALFSGRFGQEWATPVLYMRSANGLLFDVQRKAKVPTIDARAAGEVVAPPPPPAVQPRPPEARPDARIAEELSEADRLRHERELFELEHLRMRAEMLEEEERLKAERQRFEQLQAQRQEAERARAEDEQRRAEQQRQDEQRRLEHERTEALLKAEETRRLEREEEQARLKAQETKQALARIRAEEEERQARERETRDRETRDRQAAEAAAARERNAAAAREREAQAAREAAARREREAQAARDREAQAARERQSAEARARDLAAAPQSLPSTLFGAQGSTPPQSHLGRNMAIAACVLLLIGTIVAISTNSKPASSGTDGYTPTATADDHLHAGDAALKSGNYDTAISEYQAAISLNSDLADAHTRLCKAIDSNGENSPNPLKGDYANAAAECQKAVQLAPSSAEAHSNLCNALIDQQDLSMSLKGDYDQAVAECRQAITLDPTSAEAYNNYCNAIGTRSEQTIARPGDYSDAVEACKKSIELNPNLADAHKNLADLYRDSAETFLDKGNRAMAILQFANATLEYRNAVNLKPTYAAAHTQLGSILYYTGHNDEALQSLNKAIELQPQMWVSYYWRGTVQLYGKKDYEAAAQDLRKAVELKPDNAFAEYSLQTALRNQGNTTEADQHLTRAYALNENDKAISADYAKYITNK